jgi:hypothetical protein
VGLAAVRAAVVRVFSYPEIAGLSAVYSTDPILGRPADPWVGDTRTLAWASVHISHSAEERISFPSAYAGGGAPTPGGFKKVTYTVHLQIELQNRTSRDDAVDDYDALVDNITARLRSKPQFDVGDGVFSAGEGAGSSPDALIEWTHQEPWTESQSGGQFTSMWSDLAFVVVEMTQV